MLNLEDDHTESKQLLYDSYFILCMSSKFQTLVGIEKMIFTPDPHFPQVSYHE